MDFSGGSLLFGCSFAKPLVWFGLVLLAIPSFSLFTTSVFLTVESIASVATDNVLLARFMLVSKFASIVFIAS